VRRDGSPLMDYQESLDYIYTAKQAGAIKHGLVNILELLQRLGNPETSFQSVHVAGTNGKGSTCAFIESIMRKAGYKTGLFTSPYLERFTERIRIGETEIPQQDFAAIATRVRAASDSMVHDGLPLPTFFELVTACSFIYFSENKVDLAIIETGLGGRTDATNVLKPLVCAITTIGIDHSHTLGDTLEQISQEKAGIIKPNIPCVLSSANEPSAIEVVRKTAERIGSALIVGSESDVESVSDSLNGQIFNFSEDDHAFEGLEIGLLGRYQLANAATAVLTAIELSKQGFRLTESIIREGLRQTRWPGRLELLSQNPMVLIDGAHNPQGAQALAENAKRYLKGMPICLVMGAMADKDAEHMIHHFAAFATKVIVTAPPTYGRQQHTAEELTGWFSAYQTPATVCPDWQQALDEALKSGMAVVIAGSLYLAGAARTWFQSPSPGSSVEP
jgi:dihydrofolate synthase / folylpolyglutamate synthase